MRKELQDIELIERYISGGLSTEEIAAVESRLITDSEFGDQVETQRDLQVAISRTALRNEMHAAGKSVAFNRALKKWIVGGLVVAVAAGAMFYFMNVGGEGVVVDEQVRSENIEEVTSTEELDVIEESEENDVIMCEEAPGEGAVDQSEAEETSSVDSFSNGSTGGVSKSSSKASTLIKQKAQESPEQEDGLIDFNGLKMWVQPDVQTYDIRTSEGGLIETKDGTVIVVPENAFINKDQSVVTGIVEVKVLEAVNLDDMVLYNLTTSANGKALQTGGMLHFEFLSKGKSVMVDAKRPLYIEVPTDEKVSGMMAFEGEVKDGKVNWKNPKPLKKYLVNVDFSLLNFLPEGFEDAVEEELPFRKHVKFSSSTVDKIYYNLTRGSVGFGDAPVNDSFNQLGKLAKKLSGKSKGDSGFNLPTADTISEIIDYSYTDGPPLELGNKDWICGISPNAIKSIRVSEFERTFLATKEFEKRIAVIHNTSDADAILNIYVNNLTKDLYVSDSIVADFCSGGIKKRFQIFAAEKLTNIEGVNLHQKFLSRFYNKKLREFKSDQENYERRINEVNESEINNLRNNYSAEVKRNSKLFKGEGAVAGGNKREVEVTTTSFVNNEVTNGSGIKSANNSVATSNSYAFTWASGGWVNIDAYLHLLSKGSEEVVINYKGNKGVTEVYQFLSAVDNLTPLVLSEGTASVRVPKVGSIGARGMTNTFCLAISKDGSNFKFAKQRYNPYDGSEVSIELVPSSEAAIRAHLREFGVQKNLTQRLRKFENQIARRKRITDAANAKREREAKILAKKREIAKARISKKKKALQKKQAAVAEDTRQLNVFRLNAFKCEGGQSEAANTDEELETLDNVELKYEGLGE
ncbi:MAG: hypothetical protein ACJAZ2_001815 [Glaciecola sp.]|jgi:hypothetical protein